MFLIDTSVWVSMLRDRTGQIRDQLQALINDHSIVLSRFSQLELLQGCRNEEEWAPLQTYLQEQDYVELTPNSWQAAARIYFELRRQGLTVRSPIDCCIAQVALENHLLLIHNDRDFATISQIRPLQHIWFHPTIGSSRPY